MKCISKGVDSIFIKFTCTALPTIVPQLIWLDLQRAGEGEPRLRRVSGGLDCNLIHGSFSGSRPGMTLREPCVQKPAACGPESRTAGTASLTESSPAHCSSQYRKLDAVANNFHTFANGFHPP